MFSRLYSRLFSSRLREIPFIIFLSFLLTFIITRLYLFFVSRDILDLPGSVWINGTHIHHFSWGIFILVITGFWALYDLKPSYHRRLAVVYGLGLGLVFDEFALWLKLNENYYSRLSYDAVIIVSLILLNIVYFPNFWKRMGRVILKLLNLPRSTYKFIRRKIN